MSSKWAVIKVDFETKTRFGILGHESHDRDRFLENLPEKEMKNISRIFDTVGTENPSILRLTTRYYCNKIRLKEFSRNRSVPSVSEIR